MLKHDEYDKAKLLHQISCMIWFIEKHALADAQKANDAVFTKILEELQKDLDEYISKLKESFCK